MKYGMTNRVIRSSVPQKVIRKPVLAINVLGKASNESIGQNLGFNELTLGGISVFVRRSSCNKYFMSNAEVPEVIYPPFIK